MGTLQLPETFRRSYESFERYPQNLIHQTSYLGALRAYTTRLDIAAPKLFTKKPAEVVVPFRDLLPTGQAFERRNILDDTALKKWLEDRSTIDPGTSMRVGELARRRDPKCRFIFISGGHSRAPLKITREMLVRILTYHQVMPSYLDFVYVFGSHKLARELRFSGFRTQSLLESPRVLAVPGLGRSGRLFQLCYNLKAVACLSDPYTTTSEKQWSVRQAAFHHQFDVEEGTTLWIVTKGNLDIKDRVQEMTGKDGRPEDRAFETPEQCFRSSLAVHLLYCYWSTEEWRWYIQWLEDVIDQETHIAVHGPRGLGEAHRIYTPGDLQTVQNYEDKTNEAIMVLEANADVLSSLRMFYEKLAENIDFPLRGVCHEDIAAFATQVNDMIYDSRMQILRAELLLRITADRKGLVLQHLQSQATEKMESLTISMHKIGVMSQKEAIIMRIITVVTLIYLPATFVSTFFSTDVIKYQNPNSNGAGGDKSLTGSFSETALFRWLQVTIPLTTLTLLIGLVFFKIADRNRKRERLLFHSTESKVNLP